MIRRILKRPQVELDLVDLFATIARDKVEPAERFLSIAEESFEKLAANPFLGFEWKSPLPELANVRVYAMRGGFRNYLLFYKPIQNGVEILTVLHGARDLQAALARQFRGE